MLGNFSFGDYFKKEAIHWAWEFLTKELNIPQERLWVSVYKDDEEAANIWLNEIKLPKEKLFRLGDKSNFWPSDAVKNGPNGPCGPCSEIFYDYDPKRGTFPKDPDDEGSRFCEVWNLVFTQYNRQEGGKLEPLPSKNIDTGMGLERLASVLQGVKNNFETDIWQPITGAVESQLPGIDITNKRIISDHMRAICFGIADGVLPSNEGRGYVIKKLIIDITDKALQITDKPEIHTLVDAVAEAMSAYEEIEKNKKSIRDIIKNIEQSYIKVRKLRLPEFENKVKESKTADDLGNLIFSYRDTYGLALNTIEKSLVSLKLNTQLVTDSKNVYEKLMKVQQDQSRAASNIDKDVFSGDDIKLDVNKTKFLGYAQGATKATVKCLIADGTVVNEASAGTKVKVVLDQSPFYAESGGQIGDNGYLTTTSVRVMIENTMKQDDIWFHVGVV
ncbi:MAG: alanyl-tRNA synthetase, partial [Candidatus Omnitrophota bacterium]